VAGQPQAAGGWDAISTLCLLSSSLLRAWEGFVAKPGERLRRG